PHRPGPARAPGRRTLTDPRTEPIGLAATDAAATSTGAPSSTFFAAQAQTAADRLTATRAASAARSPAGSSKELGSGKYRSRNSPNRSPRPSSPTAGESLRQNTSNLRSRSR